VLGTVVAVAAMAIAPMLAGQDSIFGYLQKMNGLYAIPIFAVVVIGMFTTRVPAIAANVALLLGVVFIAVVYFAPGVAGPLASMNGFHFVGLVFALLVGLMLAWGRLAPVPEENLSLAGSGEFVPMEPWRYTRAVGWFIVAFVVLVYGWFAS
jgi:SSS family solute:Na+ symporter